MPQALEGSRYLDQSVLLEAKGRGVEFEPKPIDRIVVTGYSAVTSFGGAEETWEAILRGESAVKRVETNNPDVQIAALLPPTYEPIKEVRKNYKALGLSEFSATATLLAREALLMAGLLNEEGRVDDEKIDPRQAATWISSGYAATDKMIDVQHAIDEGKRVSPSLSLQLFPEQGNGRTAGLLGLKGPGGNTMEACATGASNIVEAYQRIRLGEAVVAVAGGIETVPMSRLDASLETFTALTALSTRNDDPEGASRPFDRDRDGFVVAAGGGLVVLESLDHALERGTPIYAEIFGAKKTMDGFPKPTEMDPERVAETIQLASYDRIARALRIPRAILAHATSTPVGDVKEAEALFRAYGRALDSIPVTAIKSNLGHLMGAAGSINVIATIQAIRDQKLPMIRNLQHPDQRVLDYGLRLVQNNYYEFDPEYPMDEGLAVAYGFGGYNAAIYISRYRELSQATA